MGQQVEWKSTLANYLPVFIVRNYKKMNIIQINAVRKTYVHNDECC